MPSSDLEVADVIEAPAADVWRVLTDPQRWPEWGPSVTAATCTDPMLRQGSRGRVRTVLGVGVPFTVTEFEPDRSWAWRIGRVRATGHRVEAIGPDRTRVVFTVPWWAAPYALVCRRALSRLRRVVGTAPAPAPPA